MKKIYSIILLTLSSCCCYGQNAEIIYKKIVNSTITIETEIAQGSGFFIDSNLIVTNFHVIEGARNAYFYKNNSSMTYQIEGFVAVDKDADLIILSVFGVKSSPVNLAEADPLPGQDAYVIGSPKGLPATITNGIISAVRNINGNELIQISASISPGSSGGPVINSDGKLIGIAVGAIEDGQSLNFAIPKSILEKLYQSKLGYWLPLSSLKNTHNTNINNKNTPSIASFKNIKIGTQIWSLENLNTSKFSNGQEIIECKSNKEWIDAGINHQPAWCSYNNDSKLDAAYGKLYNGYAVADPRGLCPIGWHIPSDIEYNTLIDILGGSNIAGGKMKELGTKHWIKANNLKYKNSLEFLPGGARLTNGEFGLLTYFGTYWTSTQVLERTAYLLNLFCFNDEVLKAPADYSWGISVRCIKD